MYTKRESELLQMYMQQYGEMPGGRAMTSLMTSFDRPPAVLLRDGK